MHPTYMPASRDRGLLLLPVLVAGFMLLLNKTFFLSLSCPHLLPLRAAGLVLFALNSFPTTTSVLQMSKLFSVFSTAYVWQLCCHFTVVCFQIPLHLLSLLYPLLIFVSIFLLAVSAGLFARYIDASVICFQPAVRSDWDVTMAAVGQMSFDETNASAYCQRLDGKNKCVPIPWRKILKLLEWWNIVIAKETQPLHTIQAPSYDKICCITKAALWLQQSCRDFGSLLPRQFLQDVKQLETGRDA